MRRLTHYSMRSLLVLVTLACVVLGWYTTNKREYDRQQSALEQVERTCIKQVADSLPGMLSRIRREGDGQYYKFFFACKVMHGVNSAELRYADPPWLGKWWDPPITLRVEKVVIKTSIDDEVLPHLLQLSSLETLVIEKSRLTPEGEARLRKSLPHATVTISPCEPDHGI